jgi:hypothetical protein
MAFAVDPPVALMRTQEAIKQGVAGVNGAPIGIGTLEAGLGFELVDPVEAYVRLSGNEEREAFFWRSSSCLFR